MNNYNVVTINEIKKLFNEKIDELFNQYLNISNKEIYFNSVIDEWIINKKNIVKDSTFGLYNYLINKHIMNYFKNIKINEINDKIINEFINDLKRKKLSNKSINDIKVIFKSILTFCKNKYYLNANIKEIKIKNNKNKINILTYNHQKILENELFRLNTRFSKGILISLYTGIRIGELCGLKYKDIDWNNKILTINRTVERIQSYDETSKTKIIIDHPKTISSERKIPLNRYVLQILNFNYINKNDFILSGNDKIIEPHTIYMYYKKILKKLNINYYTFHDLRHTFATRCIEEGFDIKSISEILGHSDINITLSTYIHPTIDQKRKLMEKIIPKNI